MENELEQIQECGREASMISRGLRFLFFFIRYLQLTVAFWIAEPLGDLLSRFSRGEARKHGASG